LLAASKYLRHTQSQLEALKFGVEALAVAQLVLAVYSLPPACAKIVHSQAQVPELKFGRAAFAARQLALAVAVLPLA